MNLLFHAAIAASLGLTMQSAPPTQMRPRPRPRPTSTQIVVRDQSGAPVPGAHVVVSGAATKEATTDANGAASLASMRDGSYRLRFEREGFITLERDVTVRTGQPAEIDVVLNTAPPPPPPPEPAPTPAPQPGAAGPPVIVSIPAFLDKNFIGRDPLKESVFGCTGDSTTRVLQIRDSLAPPYARQSRRSHLRRGRRRNGAGGRAVDADRTGLAQRHPARRVACARAAGQESVDRAVDAGGRAVSGGTGRGGRQVIYR